jgi:pimeloyl-ACP methyl ester carboxylesterase
VSASVAERVVRIGGVRIQTRVVGEGRPVLLVNGIGTHTAMWAAMEAALADGFHLIEFDAPGTGRSGLPLWPLTVPALARIAAGVLDAVGVDRADVVGYSLGGIVSQQLAVQAPQRVRRLVLAATGVGWGGVPGKATAMLNVMTPLRYWSPAFYEKTIGGLVGGRARTDPDWVRQQGRIRLQAPPSTRGYLGQLWSVGTWTTLPLLPRIQAPTLVVTGGDDPLMPAVNSALLASRIPDARVLVSETEGHLLLMDADSAVPSAIAEFLGAEELAGSRVWQEAGIVSPVAARAAIRRFGRQAQPWGTAGALLRRVYSPTSSGGGQIPRPR